MNEQRPARDESTTSEAGTPSPGEESTSSARAQRPAVEEKAVSEDGDESRREQPRREKGRRRGERAGLPVWADTLVTMVVAVIIAVLVKTFLIQPFYIPSASMNPTLLQDDKIVVSKLSPGVLPLERGDVIVFEDPGDWIPGDATENPTLRVRVLMLLSTIGLAPDPSQDHLVKRLIGMPGDHVVCADEGAALQVNGVEIEEPYINPDTAACQGAFDVTVPAGKVWVMGDNRFASADSAWHHIHGEEAFVPMDDITGKAVAIFWPANRWSGLGGGEDSFTDVPDHP